MGTPSGGRAERGKREGWEEGGMGKRKGVGKRERWGRGRGGEGRCGR